MLSHFHKNCFKKKKKKSNIHSHIKLIPGFFSKSLSPGVCVHGCIHIYYSCASKRRNKATLLLEIRGSFILVLCASECVQVCVRPNCLSNRPFVTGGGRVQFSVKIIKEGF